MVNGGVSSNPTLDDMFGCMGCRMLTIRNNRKTAPCLFILISFFNLKFAPHSLSAHHHFRHPLSQSCIHATTVSYACHLFYTSTSCHRRSDQASGSDVATGYPVVRYSAVDACGPFKRCRDSSMLRVHHSRRSFADLWQNGWSFGALSRSTGSR